MVFLEDLFIFAWKIFLEDFLGRFSWKICLFLLGRFSWKIFLEDLLIFAWMICFKEFSPNVFRMVENQTKKKQNGYC